MERIRSWLGRHPDASSDLRCIAYANAVGVAFGAITGRYAENVFPMAMGMVCTVAVYRICRYVAAKMRT